MDLPDLYPGASLAHVGQDGSDLLGLRQVNLGVLVVFHEVIDLAHCQDFGFLEEGFEEFGVLSGDLLKFFPEEFADRTAFGVVFHKVIQRFNRHVADFGNLFDLKPCLGYEADRL